MYLPSSNSGVLNDCKGAEKGDLGFINPEYRLNTVTWVYSGMWKMGHKYALKGYVPMSQNLREYLP